jgi:hypothetical protein
VPRISRIAGVVALLALTAALVIWEFGGGSIRVFGWRVSARSWDRPLLLGLVAGAIFVYAGGRNALEHWISQSPRRFRARLFVAALCLTCAAGTFFLGAHVAGGSDSYGYLSQAELWKRGSLEQPQPLALHVPLTNAQWSLSPLGYRPSVSGDGIVPTYSAGYPLLLAGAQAIIGQTGAFLVVPLCLALAIWATYRLGEIVCSPVCGLIAATLVAVSPAVSYMAQWPMSDVPALAFWTLSLAAASGPTRRAPLIAGLLASAAILIRPNLFPAAGVIALWFLFERAPLGRRLGRAAVFTLAAVPGMAATALVNAKLYGSPLASGYGSLDVLFRAGNVPLNLHHWLEWLTLTQTWLVWLALIPLLFPVRRWWRTNDNRALSLLGPFALTVALVYVTYEPFDAWWYLRFLLPAFPPLMVGLGLVAIRMSNGRAWRTVGVAAAVGFLVLHTFHRSANELRAPKRLESRYYDVAKFLDAQTPANSIFITDQHSGSLRYYAHRLTMRPVFFNEDEVPSVLAWSREQGFHAYVILEDWELPNFRRRFPHWSDTLERSPVFVYAGPPQVFVYDPILQAPSFARIPALPIPLVPRPMAERDVVIK